MWGLLAAYFGSEWTFGRTGLNFISSSSMSTHPRVCYGVLGPLSVSVGSMEISIPTRRARGVLSCLLLEPGRFVRLSSLVGALYGFEPIKSAINQVHRGVSELRKLSVPISSGQKSFRLDALAESIDCYRFQHQIELASTAVAGSDLDAGKAMYRRALELWRGPAFEGLAGPTFESAARYWGELRVTAEQAYFDVELKLGCFKEIFPRLAILNMKHPRNEIFLGQLMLSLYRSGRATEALEAYSKHAKDLAEELGVTPGPALSSLQVQMLQQDPTLLPE
ncbi:Transcriptional regulatory protein EmbR [Leucobacter aridicollis]